MSREYTRVPNCTSGTRGRAPIPAPGPVIRVTRITTPLGRMVAGATDAGVCMLVFEDSGAVEERIERLREVLDARLEPGKSRVLVQLEAQIDDYFRGRRCDFSVPLLLVGTSFQIRAWKVLLEIPFGNVLTYGEQARVAGRPNAARAVARADAANMVSIVVPCHRVIGKNGSLTGYAGGLWRKRRLLDIEGTTVGRDIPRRRVQAAPQA